PRERKALVHRGGRAPCRGGRPPCPPDGSAFRRARRGDGRNRARRRKGRSRFRAGDGRSCSRGRGSRRRIIGKLFSSRAPRKFAARGVSSRKKNLLFVNFFQKRYLLIIFF